MSKNNSWYIVKIECFTTMSINELEMKIKESFPVVIEKIEVE